MQIEKQEPTLTVTFNRAELEYIRGISQNFCGENPEYEDTVSKTIRLELFVATSRALGYAINADGTANRSK